MPRTVTYSGPYGEAQMPEFHQDMKAKLDEMAEQLDVDITIELCSGGYREKPIWDPQVRLLTIFDQASISPSRATRLQTGMYEWYYGPWDETQPIEHQRLNDGASQLALKWVGAGRAPVTGVEWDEATGPLMMSNLAYDTLHFNYGFCDEGVIWFSNSIANGIPGAVTAHMPRRPQRRDENDRIIRNPPYEQSDYFEHWFDNAIRKWAKLAIEPAKWQERSERILTALENQMASLVQNHLNTRIGTLKANIVSFQDSIDGLWSSLIEYEDKIHIDRIQLQALERGQGDYADEIRQHYRDLLRTAVFKRVEFDRASGNLKAWTQLIYLHSPDMQQRVPLGEFRIEYGLTTRRIMFFNLTNARGGMGHPHVPTDGHPCMGHLGDTMMQLHQSGNIFQLFMQLKMYLEVYNPHDNVGSYVALWWGDGPVEHLCSDHNWRTPGLKTAWEEAMAKSDGEVAETELEDDYLTNMLAGTGPDESHIPAAPVRR